MFWSPAVTTFNVVCAATGNDSATAANAAAAIAMDGRKRMENLLGLAWLRAGGGIGVGETVSAANARMHLRRAQGTRAARRAARRRRRMPLPPAAAAR